LEVPLQHEKELVELPMRFAVGVDGTVVGEIGRFEFVEARRG